MLIQQILLKILTTFQNERTLSAAFHLLKGKRSGQTIHDVGLFQLHAFFGLLPKLSRGQFDEQVDLLFAKNYIIIEENGYYQMTEIGVKQASEALAFRFDGWHYRGNEHIFFARLSLVIQSLSHQAVGVKSFIAIEKDEDVQSKVREFLVKNQFQQRPLQSKVYFEIEQSLDKIQIDEQVKTMIVYRLSGFQEPGLTWQQMAFGFHLSEMDIRLMYCSGLHQWLNEILEHAQNYPYLFDLAQGIRVDLMLTSSANVTANLYKKGHSLEQISLMRRLKLNTIEDHIVELAMNDVNFDIEPFINNADQQKIVNASEDYQTKKLKVLREIIPHVSYFQLRLALAKEANH
ncbi:recombinase RecQ [Solibacillus sp. R5-41]|uniref:helix-turn-helix domain-containing protein n=1 Tax=Solibacillus sp. R5-41 TaxID=2048654 RepID=UPI000C1278CF|nr:helix-turn-helix domain-containing protein [Solibacillus sp. R5-41]ATP39601.1 recombinase RecQ [Solibacillus sp. R5-41]